MFLYCQAIKRTFKVLGSTFSHNQGFSHSYDYYNVLRLILSILYLILKHFNSTCSLLQGLFVRNITFKTILSKNIATPT